jgi:hypothetical protein
MADVKSDPMTDGVALDGAYLRSQAKEALDTFFAPVVGAIKGFSRHTRPGVSGEGHEPGDVSDITQPET